MKRFIGISLMTAIAMKAMACAIPETHNYYLFSPITGQEFRQRVEKLTEDNWQAYLGTKQEYFYFNADDVIKAAQAKNDQLMVSYVQNLKRYLDCADQKRYEQWNYPTKAQLAARRQTLLNVRTYAQSKLKTRLRSQHALLFMRCNMMLGQHQENITFYKQTASQFIESVYRDMMENIYAGALLKTGHEVEAAQLFAQQGDYASLMTMYYKRRSCQAIEQEYQRDPNSAVLPFLLKDFVNNTQEAVDGPDAMPGKLFIRDIQQKEARQMCQLANRVLSEAKTTTPALWKSAKAWIEFLLGNRKQAATDIVAAAQLAGTERMMDCTRVLMLYITAAQAPSSERFDDYLSDELQWLDERTSTDDEYYSNAKDRLVHQVLVDKYAHQPVRAASLLKSAHASLFDTYVDTMKVATLQQYLNFVASPTQNKLDKYLRVKQDVNRQEMVDLIGTKYLRLKQWQQAIRWLQQVPVSFYNEQGYAVYAANRRYDVEPWIKRQWLKRTLEYGGTKWNLKSNPKIDFAREMQEKELGLTLLDGADRQKLCYDLAVRYAQAHFTGDCWFLMRNGKSVSDTLRVNEADLAKTAIELLQQAALTTDAKLKEKVLFALAYKGLYTNPWYQEEWNDAKMKYDRHPDSLSPQYKAFAALADFEKRNSTPSTYVSRCDEFKQFKKQYK